MNLRGKIPVEPLAEEQVVKIERAVVAGYGDAIARGHRAGSRWLLPALAAAAAAAVVAAVLVWKLRPAHDAAAPAVAAPVRVESSPDGTEVDLGDAQIAVASGAAFTVTRPDGGVVVALDHGQVDLEVASRKGRAPLVVRAGDVDVVVVGTKFSVARGAEVVVQVTEGVVRVKRGTDETRVAAGQRWSAPAQAAAGAAFPQPTAIGVAAAGTAGAPDAGGTIASGAIETTDHGTGPELHGHDTVVPDVVKDHGDHGTAGGSGRHVEHAGSGSAIEPDAGSGAPTLDLIPAIRKESVATPFEVGATGDDAFAIYMKMIGGNAEEKRRGYYGAAYVRHEQGQDSDAWRWTQAYVAQAPDGAEIESVMWMRIQIRCKHPIDEACRKVANSYVKKFQTSSRAELALKLTNSID